MNLLQSPQRSAASERNVPPGTSNTPIAKWKYPLSAPLRYWQDSSMRRVAAEICSLPLRIRESLQAPHPRNGFRVLLLRLSGSMPDVWRKESMFLVPCSADIQRLSQENRWATHLDRKMAAQAYLLGATWAIRNICSGTDSEQALCRKL